ncbi:GntR family transcriptional regulator [Alicyclobacillus fodiniaquatilis]|jgi:GntR family transcriptional regulator|uniref:GntR family transcriptional regulator n=1 Tax=Alicyclobacillus fodiniaquatilis TaxID=1661150 RepID=A0ABW4JK88_9BACL
MWLRINPRSATPVYQQMIDGVREGVAKGILKAGDRLPTVREMATLQGVNHNTVAKAYRELERDKVIETLRSKGTFIATTDAVPNRQEKLENMKLRINQLIVEAHHVQIPPERLKQMFTEAVDMWMREMEENQA